MNCYAPPPLPGVKAKNLSVAICDVYVKVRLASYADHSWRIPIIYRSDPIEKGICLATHPERSLATIFGLIMVSAAR